MLFVTGPSLPLHVTGLMMIPLETNATNCSDLSNSMDSISNYFATIARSNFALFCDTAEVPFCGDSLQGVETTQECYQPPGSSARRRRQADQEVMINVTLQVRANMTKEEIVRFLEQTRMDLATGGTRQIPLTGATRQRSPMPRQNGSSSTKTNSFLLVIQDMQT